MSTSAAEFYGYTPVPIDVDQGVTIRYVGQNRVFMYKQKPGLYLNPKGGLVDDVTAQAAGFDVAAHHKAMRVQAKIREATAKILAEQKQALAEIQGSDPDVAEGMPGTLLSPELIDQLVTGKTREGKPRSTKDFEIVHQGAGLWQVQTRDDAREVVSPRLVEAEAITAMIEAQIERDTAPETAGS